MKIQALCAGLLGCALALGAVGCAPSGVAARDGGRRAPPPRGPLAARANRGATPPAGATSVGTMNRPSVMGQTVPIDNAEVYQFTYTPEGATQPVTVQWAYDAATMRNYIWGTQDVACASTGANAPAAAIMEINADGSGGFMYASECADVNLAGCQFDAGGNTTTCGACSVTAAGAVACVE